MTTPARLVAEASTTYIAHSWDALRQVPAPSTPGTFFVTFVPDASPARPDTDEAFQRALADAIQRGRPKWLEIMASEGGVVSVSQMATLLGISRQAVDKRRRAGRLLGFRDGGREYLYPAWQVRDGKLLPGLERVLAVLRAGEHDTKSQFIYFLSPFARLWDQRPLDYLRNGGVDAIDAAEEAALGYLEQGGD